MVLRRWQPVGLNRWWSLTQPSVFERLRNLIEGVCFKQKSFDDQWVELNIFFFNDELNGTRVRPAFFVDSG